MNTNINTQRETFEQALVNTIREIMGEYDAFMKSPMAEVSSIEAATMGDFTDPESDNKYGFKIIIGKVGFWEDKSSDDEDEEYDED